MQARSHGAQGVAPTTAYQHEIALVDLPLTQGGMQGGQREALLGDQEETRGVAIEAMHELEEPRLGTRRPELLDEAERNTGPAVNGKAGRLVEGEECVVFVEDGHPEAGGPGGRHPGAGRRGSPDGRQPDDVAQRQPAVRAGTPLVHPHLPAAQDAIDVALGHALEDAGQEVVDALTRRRLVDRDPADGVLAQPVHSLIIMATTPVAPLTRRKTGPIL